MTKEEISDMTRFALSDRIRSAVKTVLEQVIEKELTEHQSFFAGTGYAACDKGSGKMRNGSAVCETSIVKGAQHEVAKVARATLRMASSAERVGASFLWRLGGDRVGHHRAVHDPVGSVQPSVH